VRQHGHEVVAASPKNGVDTITGEGPEDAMAGTRVVIDLSNSPSFEDEAVLRFFQTSGRNLLAAEAAAGVGHHVALSIVGIERSPDNGYFRAKVAQEKLIEASRIPYTIVRATQFLEFIGAIADASAEAIRSQVNDGPVTTYQFGESFSELPGDRHAVSANASATSPAKLLAVFVVDTNETELTIPFGN
jgi:uncharacterized protein YbjT (DUF2867 family)